VSFEVPRGAALASWPQRSGKSTLLQMVCGTLSPTTGSVQVNGRVAALLELGSGFNPELTGRENVFLNAAILGLSEAEIRQRYDAIVAFAEIGDFLEQPIRTYSSGMVVRLAFAVSVNVDADVIVIDEALSVGDARFQLKCAKAMDACASRARRCLREPRRGATSGCARGALLSAAACRCAPPQRHAQHLQQAPRRRARRRGDAEDIRAIAEKPRPPPSCRRACVEAPSQADEAPRCFAAECAPPDHGPEFSYGGELKHRVDRGRRRSGEAAPPSPAASVRAWICSSRGPATRRHHRDGGGDLRGLDLRTNTYFQGIPRPSLPRLRFRASSTWRQHQRGVYSRR
jgi:ABC-type transport system involved in cytochrome c biogenesis ATPase subunit